MIKYICDIYKTEPQGCGTGREFSEYAFEITRTRDGRCFRGRGRDESSILWIVGELVNHSLTEIHFPICEIELCRERFGEMTEGWPDCSGPIAMVAEHIKREMEK